MAPQLFKNMTTIKKHFFHILPDSTYSEVFITQIQQLKLHENNFFACRSANGKDLKYVKHKVRTFQKLTEIKEYLEHYDEIVVHYLRGDYYIPLSKYITTNKLALVPWGSDIYRSPIYAYQTLDKHSYKFNNRFLREELRNLYYKLFLNKYLKKVLSKVTKVYTWIPSFHADIERVGNRKYEYSEFNYGKTPLEFGKIDFESVQNKSENYFVLGHSASPGLNHLSFLEEIFNSPQVNSIRDFRILVPISYGNESYKVFLKKEIRKKSYANRVEYVEDYLPFKDYLKLIASSSGYIINSSIAIGGGNIGIAIMLGKPIFLKEDNVLKALLGHSAIKLFSIKELTNINQIIENQAVFKSNIEGYKTMLNIEKINRNYVRNFG